MEKQETIKLLTNELLEGLGIKRTGIQKKDTEKLQERTEMCRGIGKDKGN